MARLGISLGEYRVLARRAKDDMEHFLETYHAVRPALDVSSRTVILVDDCLATWMTALAAVCYLRKLKSRMIIFAAQVCSPEAVSLPKSEFDAVVCLTVPDDFYSVGPWFERFEQLEDAQVLELLASK
jgi:predicted phosphoribosyltransferase